VFHYIERVRRFLGRLGFALCIAGGATCAVLHVATYIKFVPPVGSFRHSPSHSEPRAAYQDTSLRIGEVLQLQWPDVQLTPAKDAMGGCPFCREHKKGTQSANSLHPPRARVALLPNRRRFRLQFLPTQALNLTTANSLRKGARQLRKAALCGDMNNKWASVFSAA
jgi:hypothetical protein